MCIHWKYDSLTEEIAREVPIVSRSKPKPQVTVDWDISEKVWRERLRSYGEPLRKCSKRICPEVIIKQFSDARCSDVRDSREHYLHGLILLTRWGGMDRTLNTIYKKEPSEEISDKSLCNIYNALKFCAESLESLEETHRIDESWERLTGCEKEDQLSWTPAMASKTLHFLSRAVGFTRNPPVAIDHKVILKKAWPAWKEIISKRNDITCPPKSWKWKKNDDSLTSYLRYMTAICVWAEKKGWTTTQMEATIFAEYYS